MTTLSTLNGRLANAFAALRAAGKPLTASQVGEAMGKRCAVWECRALESIGAVRAVDCATVNVEVRFEARPMKEWAADISTAAAFRY
jgi:hypothetical protein